MTIQRNSKQQQAAATTQPNRRINLLILMTLVQVILLVWFIWFSTTGSGTGNTAGTSGADPEIVTPQTEQHLAVTAETVGSDPGNMSGEMPIATAVTSLPAESLPPMRTPIRIEVLNGTGISKLAWRFSQRLIEQGIDVLETANADRQNYRQTRIICRSDDIRQANYLAQLLQIPLTKIEQISAPDLVDIDVTLILGADHGDLKL